MHFDEAVVFLDDPEDVEAADARQPDVEQHQVDVLLLAGSCRAASPLADRQHAEVAPEDRRQRLPHALVVVDDQHGLAAGVIGMARCIRRGRVLWQAVPTLLHLPIR